MTEAAQKKIIGEHTIRPGFRWFGIIAPGDPSKGVGRQYDAVPINAIKAYQGVTDIVSALSHIPQGEVWTQEEIAKRKIEIEFEPAMNVPRNLSGLPLYQWYVQNGKPTGLRWDTVESLPFTEAIKSCDEKNPADLAERTRHIENFKQSLRNLGALGIHNVVGNFMPVADWTRTGYVTRDDGSKALEYNHAAFTAFDTHILRGHDKIPALEQYLKSNPYNSGELGAAQQYWDQHLAHDPKARVELTKMIVAGLPGCQGIKSSKDFAQMGDTPERWQQEEQWITENLLPEYRKQVEKYKGWDKARLRKNIAAFLDEVVPVAQTHGIRLCAHPDDPAFTPFMGTPRTVGNEDDYRFLLDHGCGINLCTGSLMANPENRKDIFGIIDRLARYGKSKNMTMEEIFPHVHLRPIETDGKNFVEGNHAEHVEELRAIIATLLYHGWKGVYRPDHAPTPTYEIEKYGKAIGDRGYHGHGRAEGLDVLWGLFKGLEKQFDDKAIEQKLIAKGLPHHEEEIQIEKAANLRTYTQEAHHKLEKPAPSSWAHPDPRVLDQVQLKERTAS